MSIFGSVTASKVTFSTPGYTVQNFFLNGTSNGLTVQADADATISSSIFGTSSSPFTKTGAGTLTLTGSSPVFFGSATVAAGEMRFTGFGSPNFSTPYILADAPGVALTLGNSFNNVASLGGGGANGGVVRPNVSSGSISLSIGGSSGDASFGGALQDNGAATLAFQKNGTSTQTLTGANTYSGATTAAGSALVFAGANGSALNTNAVSVTAAGVLRLDNSGAANGKRLASNVPITLSGGTLSLVGNTATDVMQTVGTVSFSRASTVSVAPMGTAAAQLVFSGGLTQVNNGTISFSGGGHVTIPGLTNVNGIVGGYATVGSDWAAVDASGRVFAYTGYTSDLGSASGQDNLRLISSGGDTTTLPKTQSRNSLNLVNNGSTSAVLDLGTGQKLDLTSGGLLTSGSGGHVIQNGTLSTSSRELIVTNQAPLTVASTVADTSSAVALTKSGAGTLTLTGTNTYTGATNVVQGTLRVASDGNLGAGTAVVLGGGTLQAAAGFTSAKSLQGAGGILNTAGFDVAFNGGNNTGEINKNGAGQLTLTGTVASVNLNGGTLRLTNLAVGNTASISLSSGRLEASGSGVRQVQSLSGGSAPEISPGAVGQPAMLTLGSLSTLGSTVIDFDLGSGATDLLTISSSLAFNGGSNSMLLFRFGDLGGTSTGTAYTLLNLPASNFGLPLSLSSFGFDPASTATGYRGAFNLANNTLSVTFTAVPEPAAPVLLLGALGIWGAWARSRRERSA